MAKNGLDKWFRQKWVDIGSRKKDGSFAKCGRSKQKADAKRKYPKCVPLAKATRMSASQRASAVKRKRAAGNTGPKPTNVKTFTKRSKASTGGAQYIGPAIKSDYAGTMLSNKSYEKYYKGMID
jgi:hypothetical protein